MLEFGAGKFILGICSVIKSTWMGKSNLSKGTRIIWKSQKIVYVGAAGYDTKFYSFILVFFNYKI